MDWIMVGVCMLVLLICAGAWTLSVGEDSSESDAECEYQGGVADAREAHYMSNFWSYDGSEQQDWDE